MFFKENKSKKADPILQAHLDGERMVSQMEQMVPQMNKLHEEGYFNSGHCKTPDIEVDIEDDEEIRCRHALRR